MTSIRYENILEFRKLKIEYEDFISRIYIRNKVS